MQRGFESWMALGIPGELGVNYRATDTTVLFHTAMNSHMAYRRRIVDIYEARAKVQQLQSLLVSQHGTLELWQDFSSRAVGQSGNNFGRICWIYAGKSNYAAPGIMSIRSSW